MSGVSAWTGGKVDTIGIGESHDLPTIEAIASPFPRGIWLGTCDRVGENSSCVKARSGGLWRISGDGICPGSRWVTLTPSKLGKPSGLSS